MFGNPPKYKVGDLVIICRTAKEGVSWKEYNPTLTYDVFTISELVTRLPVPRYFLFDTEYNAIGGRFQDHEHSIVRNV